MKTNLLIRLIAIMLVPAMVLGSMAESAYAVIPGGLWPGIHYGICMAPRQGHSGVTTGEFASQALAPVLITARQVLSRVKDRTIGSLIRFLTGDFENTEFQFSRSPAPPTVNALVQSILAQLKASEGRLSPVSRLVSAFTSSKALNSWVFVLYGIVLAMPFAGHYHPKIFEIVLSLYSAYPILIFALPLFGFFILPVVYFGANSIYFSRRAPRVLRSVNSEEAVKNLIDSKTKLTLEDLRGLYLKVRANPENVIRARQALRCAPLDQTAMDILWAAATVRETDAKRLWNHARLLPLIAAPYGPLVCLLAIRDHLIDLPLSEHARDRYAGRNGFVDADLAVALFSYVVGHFIDPLQDRPMDDLERRLFLWTINAIYRSNLYDVGWWRRWRLGPYLDFWKDVRYMERFNRILSSFPPERVEHMLQEIHSNPWMDHDLPSPDWPSVNLADAFYARVFRTDSDSNPLSGHYQDHLLVRDMRTNRMTSLRLARGDRLMNGERDLAIKSLRGWIGISHNHKRVKYDWMIIRLLRWLNEPALYSRELATIRFVLSPDGEVEGYSNVQEKESLGVPYRFWLELFEITPDNQIGIRYRGVGQELFVAALSEASDDLPAESIFEATIRNNSLADFLYAALGWPQQATLSAKAVQFTRQDKKRILEYQENRVKGWTTEYGMDGAPAASASRQALEAA